MMVVPWVGRVVSIHRGIHTGEKGTVQTEMKRDLMVENCERDPSGRLWRIRKTSCTRVNDDNDATKDIMMVWEMQKHTAKMIVWSRTTKSSEFWLEMIRERVEAIRRENRGIGSIARVVLRGQDNTPSGMYVGGVGG